MPFIQLIPIDDALRRAVEEPGEHFAALYGASLGENKARIHEVVTRSLELFEQTPRAPEWGVYLTADRDRALVIGTCGFTHGPEADGTVEIAYFTFPEYEGRGYAKAMARELLTRGLQSDAVRDVIAHTLPEYNASTRILASVGLQQVGEADDAEVGKVWRWAYRPSS